MTSYEEIYDMFMENCKTENINIPQTNDGKYRQIKNAVLLFNNRMEDNLQCDNLNEVVNRVLSGNELLIIAHYLRISLLRNNRTYKNTLFTTFTKEVGIRNINSQLKSLNDEINEEELIIENIIFNAEDEL